MAMNGSKQDEAVNVRITKEALPPKNGHSKQQDQKEPEFESKVAKLLSTLIGGDGSKVKVYRQKEEGGLAYCCTLPVDDDLTGNFEDVIGRRIGGGTFYMRGWQGSEPVGQGVTVEIDEDLYPPFKSRREKLRDGEDPDAAPVMLAPNPGQPATSFPELMSVMEQMRQSEKQASMQMQAQTQQFMLMMIQMQEQSAARQVDLIRAMAGGGKSSEGDGVAKVLDYMKLFQTMQGTFGGSGSSDGASFGERVLIAPLQTIAGKIGERVGDMVRDQMKPQPPQLPAPVQPQPKPVQQQMQQAAEKTEQQVKQEMLKRPPPNEIRLPPWVKLFAPGETPPVRSRAPVPSPQVVSKPTAPERPAPTPSIIEQSKPTNGTPLAVVKK